MVQAWSMGSAQKCPEENKQKKAVPGPGTYSPEKTSIGDKNPPKWIIGKSKRSTFQGDNSKPGPGQYNVPEKIIEGPKYVMGMKTMSTEDLHKGKDVPGPGQYTPSSNAFSTIKFSMGLKGGGSITSRDGPGPGTYQAKSGFANVNGAVTFCSNKRFNLDQNGNIMTKSIQEIPGPGAYKGNFKVLTRNQPNSFIGTANRDKNTFYDTGAKFNPGPGTYQQKNMVGFEGKSVSMSPRRPDTSPQVGKDTPGPGTYDQTKYYMTVKQNGNCKIGTSQRSQLMQSARDIPAPNHYSQDNTTIFKSDPKMVFGSGKRPPLTSINHYPGPGQYLVPQKAIEGRQYSLSGRYKADKPRDTPGPDAYDSLGGIQLKQKKPPSFQFGSGPKQEVDLTTRRHVPGPGTYELKEKTAPGVVFSHALRSKEKKAEQPGPGTYKIPVRFGDVPKYLIPNKEEAFKFV